MPPAPRSLSRIATLTVLGLLVSHVGAHLVAIHGTEQALDTDGHLVRTANLWAALTTGDPVFTTGIGLPTWATPEHPAESASSPYPPGYRLVYLPALALLDGEVEGYRLWSVGLGAATVGLTALLAHRLAGRAAAVAAAALLTGSVVWMGLGAQASVSTLVAGAAVLAGLALERGEGFRRRGAGVRIGLALALALQVKWSVALLVAPALALLALDVARESRRAAWGVGALAGLALAEAAVLGACVAGGVPEERTVGLAAVGAAGLGAVGIARWARAAGVARLPELATAAAWTLGPGLAWYGASTEALRWYGAAGAAGRERGDAAELLSTTVGYLTTQLPTAALVLPLALWAAARRGALAVGLVLAPVGFAAVLALSGESRLLWTGTIAARLWLEPLPLLAVAGGLAVSLAGRWAGRLAGLVALLSLGTTWSFALAPCAEPPARGAILQWCGGALPRWNLVAPPTAWRLPVDRDLPRAEAVRVTPVVLSDRQKALADEAPYVRGLVQKRRALPLVGVRPEALGGWLDDHRDAVDDLVLVNLPAEVAASAGFATRTVRPVRAGPGPRSVLLLEGPAE